MSRSGPELSEVERDLRDHVHLYWKSYALQGAASLLLGLLAILAPFAATFATVLLFGIILLVAGLFGLAAAVTMRGAAGRGSSFLLAVLVILLGLVVLFDPFAGAVSLTVMLAIFFVLSAFGNFALARAMRERGGRAVLLYLSAGLNVALALFLVVGLPATAVWAVGLFLGFSFAMSGAATLLAALSARQA
jgi:uncharacterized membrane protein HdeD (DUF308 family)